MTRTRGPVGLSVHIYPADFHHASRLLRVTDSLVKRSVARRVMLVATNMSPSVSRRAIGEAREVLSVGTLLGSRGGFEKSLRLVEWSIRVLWALRRIRVDMVNCHSLSSLPLSVLLKWWHRSILVYEPHELETETLHSRGARRRIAKWLEASLIGRADLVIVVSEGIRAHYMRAYGLKSVSVILNTPEAAEEASSESEGGLRKKCGIPEDEVVFMYQGLLAAGRCVEVLLDAFRMVPPDRHLVLLGFGPLEDTVRSASESAPNIHFLPAVPVEQVAALTRGADVGFALLSDTCLNHRFALPNKLFQYLHSGIPVVVSDFEEMGDLVRRFQCGWSIRNDPADVAALVTSIDQAGLMGLRAGVGLAGEQLVWSHEEQKLVELYRSLTGGVVPTEPRPWRVCSRCVMDTSVPDIVFNAHGVCNYCRSAEERLRGEYFGASGVSPRLGPLIDEIKRAGAAKRYDCIIGVSGGMDSTYLAYLAKRELGLRPLAVHLDNGWNSDLSVGNIQLLLDRLGIDLHTHVVDWDEFRDLQLAFLRASVPNAEIPTDHGIAALLYRMAARYGVRFILHGGNLVTESIMPAVWMEGALDLRYLRAVHRRFGSKPLITFPTISFMKLGYATFVGRVRYIGLLNYVPYRKEVTKALLERELGWRAYEGKHFESIYTRWFQGWFLPQKFGMDKRRPHFSSLIVSGQMSRADALRELEHPPYDSETASDDIRYVCRKLGLSDRDLSEMMAAPPARLDDFPNHMRLLQRFGPVVRYVKALATARLTAR